MIPGQGRGAGFASSFRYAFEGIAATFKGRNFRIQSVFALVALLLCFVLGTTPLETAAVVLCIGLVLSFECLNTALEAVVDLACPQIHPLAKLAKDCAAAAVLILALASFIIALLIFAPKLF